jgi:hypothetical protein
VSGAHWPPAGVEPIVGRLSTIAPPDAASEPRALTCEDCFFRQQLLCALPGNVTCPTFRAGATAALRSPAPPPPRHLAAA